AAQRTADQIPFVGEARAVASIVINEARRKLPRQRLSRHFKAKIQLLDSWNLSQVNSGIYEGATGPNGGDFIAYHRIGVDDQPVSQAGDPIVEIDRGEALCRIRRDGRLVGIIRLEKLLEGERQSRTSEHRRNTHADLQIWSRLERNLVAMNERLRRKARAKQVRRIEVPRLAGELAEKELHTRWSQQFRKQWEMEG